MDLERRRVSRSGFPGLYELRDDMELDRDLEREYLVTLLDLDLLTLSQTPGCHRRTLLDLKQ